MVPNLQLQSDNTQDSFYRCQIFTESFTVSLIIIYLLLAKDYIQESSYKFLQMS